MAMKRASHAFTFTLAMDSEAQAMAPPPAPPRKPRLGKALAWMLLVLLALLVSLAAALWWALATESGARFVLARALQAAGPDLTLEGVHGRLIGPLRIDRLRQQSQGPGQGKEPGQQIEAHGVELRWSPSALWSRRLQIEALEVERLVIITSMQSDPSPPSLPSSLALPLQIGLERLHIKRTEVLRGPLPLAELGALTLALDYDRQRYRLRLAPLALSANDAQLALLAQVQGETTLADRKPYAVQGTLDLSSQTQLGQQALRASGQATLAGTLEALQLGLQLDLAQAGAPAQVQGQIQLQAFAERILGPSRLQARELDLALFSEAAPHTRINLSLAVDAAGRGQLQMNNAAPGDWSARKLPLTSLRLAFAQEARRFLLRDIDARLGQERRDAGRVQGHGELAGGALQLDLQLTAVDLSGLDQRIRRSALFGQVRLQHSEGQDRLQVDLAERGKLPLTLQARASMTPSQIDVEEAHLQAAGGELRATARIGMAGEQALQAEGSFARFSPRAFVQFDGMPELLLNGRFTLKGNRAPQLGGKLQFELKDSKLAGQPLQGQGQVALSGQVLDVPQLRLQAGDNRVELSGRLSPEKQSGAMRYQFDLARLEQLGFGWRGALKLQGNVQGQARAPSVDGVFEAQALTLPDVLRLQSARGTLQLALDPRQPLALDHLQLDAQLQDLAGAGTTVQTMASASVALRFGPQAARPFELRLQASDLRDGERRLDQVELNGRGNTGQHGLELNARRGQQLLNLRASGGLSWKDKRPEWRGQLDSLQSQGRLAARLLAPAAVSVSASRQTLDNARLQTAAGQIEIDSLAHDAGRIASRGRLLRVQAEQLLRLLPKPPALATDLVLDGEWDLELAQRLRGQASLRRISGDVTVQGASPVTLGLNQLQASIKAAGERVDLEFDTRGQQLGQMTLKASVGLAPDGKRMRIAGSAPLSGSAHADIPNLNWLAGLISPTLITEGRLQSEIRLGGTLDNPKLAGQLGGERLRIALTELGVDLRQGSLSGTFTEDRFLLQSLRFTGADGAGEMSLSGPVRLAGGQPSGELKLQARRYPLFNRSDRRIILSGASDIVLASQGVRVRGGFNIDEGFIDIGRSELPQLSDDVVIVGRKKSEASPLATDIALKINLGDRLRLQGRGLKARLAGELQVENRPGHVLETEGTVRVAEGTFSAYGRELAIEQGVVRFTGAINNPALDIRAMRRGQEVSAGVSIRGTALAPRVTLVSDPTVPDAEKLSWLVLGHGLSGSGGADAASLQAAAAGLLTGSAAAGAQNQLASHFGIDSFGVSRTQDNLQQRVVTLGRQVSDRLFLSVAQNLGSSTSALRIRYTLTPRLSAEVEAGATSFLSLFYNIAFD